MPRSNYVNYRSLAKTIIRSRVRPITGRWPGIGDPNGMRSHRAQVLKEQEAEDERRRQAAVVLLATEMKPKRTRKKKETVIEST